MYKIRKYHEKKVMSLTYEGEDQSFSVGIVAPGEFAFGAVVDEYYKVTSGELSFWEDGSEWKTFKENEEFVAHESKDFKLKADKVSSYICYYK